MSIINSLLKSYDQLFCIEVTVVLGCPVNCVYCPQEQLRQEGKTKKKKLDFDDFRKAIDNVDMDAQLGWTGYSEPCLSPDLEKMVDYAKSKNMYQYISTTLSGSEKSVDYVINSKDFYRFQLHLPDKAGLMTGLEVDDTYASKVKTCLEQKLKDGLASTVSITCFGEDYHPLIKDIVMQAFKSGEFNKNRFKFVQQVYTRAGGLDRNKLSESGLNFIENSPHSEKGQFYCQKHKMNSPVLLPDGSLSICSFDYGFRETYGNLFQEKMSNIRRKWLFKVSSKFNQGKLIPCTECEYYLQF